MKHLSIVKKWLPSGEREIRGACFFLMENYNEPGIVNIGTGTDVSIAALAHIIQKITGYTGELVFDTSKPDGTMRKLLDVSKINGLGWHASIDIEEGISKTYKDFVEHYTKYAAIQKAVANS